MTDSEHHDHLRQWLMDVADGKISASNDEVERRHKEFLLAKRKLNETAKHD